MKVLIFLIMSVFATTLWSSVSEKPKVKIEVLDSYGNPINWKKKSKVKGNSFLIHDEDLEAFLGSSVFLRWTNTDFGGTISNPRFSSTSTYKVISTSCNPGVGSCSTIIEFTPSAAGYDEVFFLQNWKGCAECDTEVLSDKLIGLGIKFIKPPRCPTTSEGSIIKNESRVLSERIPIAGADFDLVYSSNFATQYLNSADSKDGKKLTQRINAFNPEGWSVSNVHFYDVGTKTLYLGTGEILKRDYYYDSHWGGFSVPHDDEIFVFNVNNGRHFLTRDRITGINKLGISHTPELKIASVSYLGYQHTVYFNRDTEGKLLSITGREFVTTSISVNEAGLISSITTPKGEISSFTYYPETELLEKFVKPNLDESLFEYSSTGRLLLDEGGGGNFWELQDAFDGEKGYIKKSSALDRSTKFYGNRDSADTYSRKIISPAGFVTEYKETPNFSREYNNLFETVILNNVDDERFGSLLPRLSEKKEIINGLTRTTTISQIAPLANPTDPFSYTLFTKIVDINGKKTTTTFEKDTKERKTISPMGVETKIQLNEFDNPVSVQHGSDTPITFSYNTRSLVSQTTQAGHNTTNYEYTWPDFRLISVTNALNQKTSYDHDANRRVTSVTLPDLRVINLSYDENGRLTQVTPPGRPAHEFAYNDLGVLSTYAPPMLDGAPMNTQYIYNLDKQLTEVQRPDNSTLVYSYNSTTGLLDYITSGSAIQGYTYIPDTEKVATVTSFDGVSSAFTYFGMNRIASEEQSSDAIAYKVELKFDNSFRPIRRTISSWDFDLTRIDTAYQDDDKPVKVGDLKLNYESVSGRLATTVLGKVRDARTYDSYGNLISYRAAYYPGTKCNNSEDKNSCAKELYSFILTRDSINRISTKVEKINGETTTYGYSYDTSGRLSSVTRNGVVESSYSYDSNSNRISGTQNAELFTAVYDSQDRMLSYSQGEAQEKLFQYNLNGELTQIAQGSEYTSFTPDALGRIKAVTLPDYSTLSYSLDHSGRRVQKLKNGSKVYRNIYEDEFKIAAEVGPLGQFKEYVYATNINSADYIKDGSKHYKILKDHLGSPRLVVNASTGAIVQRMDYNEWGMVTLDTNPGFQSFGFAGGIYDQDTKLVKFGARDYDGSTGRWLSKDPIRFDGGDTNLYGYVLQDPINWIDPKGTWPEWLDKGVCKVTGRCDPTDIDSQDWWDTLDEVIDDIGKNKEEDACSSI